MKKLPIVACIHLKVSFTAIKVLLKYLTVLYLSYWSSGMLTVSYLSYWSSGTFLGVWPSLKTDLQSSYVSQI